MNSLYPDPRVPSSANYAAFTKVICYSLLALLLAVVSSPARSQAVTGVITDYNTYWKSTAAAINNVKPDNSHNLLAFTYNGVTYSTGVNDALLASHGENFSANDFWSLPVGSISGTITSNTKVGLGEKYDGVSNGASHPAPSNNLASYLTDGIKGLDLGTCVANLPSGSMTFLVSSITPSSIGDGIPDILVTQVADPSGSTDRYQFTDVNGAIVGNYKDMLFTSINSVGNWTADFYDVTNPMTLSSGFTKTDRQLRLWAADLSEFGITAANYQSVRNFRIGLSGNSDVAFVAYSNKSFAIKNILPVMLGPLTGTKTNGKGLLKWNTYTENNSAWFVIEKINAGAFISIDSVKAAGNSTSIVNYSYTDNHLEPGKNYYRLRMVDLDGKTKYSSVVSISSETPGSSFSIYPNPATSGEAVYAVHDKSSGTEWLHIFSSAGILLYQQSPAKGSLQTKLNWSTATQGIYYIVWENGTEKKTQKIFIQ